MFKVHLRLGTKPHFGVACPKIRRGRQNCVEKKVDPFLASFQEKFLVNSYEEAAKRLKDCLYQLTAAATAAAAMAQL